MQGQGKSAGDADALLRLDSMQLALKQHSQSNILVTDWRMTTNASIDDIHRHGKHTRLHPDAAKRPFQKSSLTREPAVGAWASSRFYGTVLDCSCRRARLTTMLAPAASSSSCETARDVPARRASLSTGRASGALALSRWYEAVGFAPQSPLPGTIPLTSIPLKRSRCRIGLTAQMSSACLQLARHGWP